MRAELTNLNNCAVPFLSRAATNLCWYYNITKTTAAQNEDALSYHSVRGLYFQAVVFVATIHKHHTLFVVPCVNYVSSLLLQFSITLYCYSSSIVSTLCLCLCISPFLSPLSHSLARSLSLSFLSFYLLYFSLDGCLLFFVC